MAQIEDQRILVWCNCSENIKSSIIDAVYLAIKLNKELCLFANYISEKDKNKFKKTVSVYAETIKKDIPNLDVSVLVLKGELHELVNDLGEKYNSILLCCNGKLNKKKLKAFYRSNFPFLFSKALNHNQSKFKKIIIPIDFRNNTKDATLWGSYLGRFNQSEIILKKANDIKGHDLNEKVNNIVAFVKKFYGQFFFNFWFEIGKSGSWGIHKETAFESKDFDLHIFTGSIKISFLDRIIGPFESRIINQSKTPTLLINPQKDMFVLCN
ncbi:MAG: hypothetical protein PF541_02895 [Prolixibacteraceae bacterium]|jgi:hypothetical protein|nr:hypothetical protein [Prolixibacteraceae bacterium]